MYLKRLDVFGFKSFAERTEMEFVSGITAVVGPNGSGKSNVSDAIRWVLGEQSAKSLRGAKMEDIIFSGSESRKALNYGEVSLTLDNTDGAFPIDYSEVTVTRRVYRSGESEFFLNKQACRLKDITELFMDTGLGKEAYSIIGQGRIEEILSTKAEDRRGIFEEAAGVVKYKSRKKDAVRKLEETEANLLRITDIILELRDQLAPLKEQSEKAKTFKVLKKELAEKEIAVLAYSIETLHEKWQAINQQVLQLKEEEERLQLEIHQEDVQIEQIRWQLTQQEEQLEKEQANLLLATEELEKLEGQKEVLKERQKNFTSNKEEFQEKLLLFEERKLQLSLELEQKERDLTKVKEDMQGTEAELEQVLDQYEQLVPDLEEKLEHLKADYIEGLNQQASSKNELRHLEQQKEQMKHRLNKLQEENRKFIDERTALQAAGNRQSQLLATLEQQSAELNKQIQQAKTEYLQVQEVQRQQEEKYRNYLNQVEQLNNRLRFLQELKEDYSGYFQGVKEVLKARNTQLKGIIGAIAELIQVPKEYQTAIETALGSALQHIVVQDEAAGREAIQFLKRKQLGRATFLPLNVIRGKRLAEADQQVVLQEQGVIGVAAQLITFKEGLDQVVSNLLGQVIVTKSLKDANEVAKRTNYRFRLVTLEGDLVNPGGSMTGGSIKSNTAHLLGREQEIERLQVEWTKGKEATEALVRTLELTKQRISEVEARLTESSQALEKIKQEELREKEILAKIGYQEQHVTDQLSIYDQEVSAYEEELDELSKRESSCLDYLEELASKTEEIKATIEHLEVMRKETVAEREKLNEDVTRLKVDLARKKEIYQNMTAQVHKLVETSTLHEQEMIELQENLAHLAGNMNLQHSQESILIEQLEEKKVAKENSLSQIELLRNLRKKNVQLLEEREIKTKDLRKTLKVLESDTHQREVQANRLDVELENLLQFLAEEYELTYELARAEYPLSGAYEEVKQEVNQLKLQIQNLGEVNLGSIEEYERLMERSAFLQAQEQDLSEAKRSLYEMIGEMDQIMIKRFQETFTAIRHQFHDVFQQLFGGGRADLILSNPDDLLTTGVDIVAQPPGKKLQHLGLLSGGERALTAIALLFSTLRVKPVPFCVLDEVEAALDEANVSRFVQYLREFSSETQFIVITHRKGTMEGSDVLYGITMQESGVSKLVSVKLAEAEKVLV